MNKRGFMLLEVLLATAIAALISAALLLAYGQINKATVLIDAYTDLEERALLLTRQITRDITGACVPRYPEKKQPSGVSAGHDHKKEPKPATKVFYGTVKEGRLAMLTFITNNPLQVYWGAQAGKAKPALARVVYRVEQEKSKQLSKNPSYVIMRQESYQLESDAFAKDAPEPIRAYALVRGIKNITVSYGVFVAKESGGAGQEKQLEYKTFDVWGLEKDADNKKAMRRSIPHEVTVAIELWDERQQRTKSVRCIIPIIPDFDKASASEQQAPPSLPRLPAMHGGGQR